REKDDREECSEHWFSRLGAQHHGPRQAADGHQCSGENDIVPERTLRAHWFGAGEPKNLCSWPALAEILFSDKCVLPVIWQAPEKINAEDGPLRTFVHSLF